MISNNPHPTENQIGAYLLNLGVVYANRLYPFLASALSVKTHLIPVLHPHSSSRWY